MPKLLQEDLQPLSHIYAVVPSEHRRRLVDILRSNQVISLYIDTFDAIGFFVKLESRVINRDFVRNISLIREEYKMSLDSSLSFIWSEFHNLDYSRSYSRDEIVSNFYPLIDFFESSFDCHDKVSLNCEAVLKLLCELLRYRSKKFRIMISHEDTCVFRALMVNTKKLGRTVKGFDDLFYETLFALIIARKDHKLESLQTRMVEWQQTIEPDRAKWSRSEADIRRKVEKILHAARKDNPKFPDTE